MKMRALLVFMVGAFATTLVAADVSSDGAIDRRALVGRHAVTITAFDARRPLSVGNGEFAFNVDVTGLQTFAAFNTMSHWGWHTGSPPAGTKVDDYQMQPLPTHGRSAPYPFPDPKHPQISDWLASSPHRVNLGRLGFDIRKKNGQPASEQDLQQPRQELDLWRGVITSTFAIEGSPVRVVTACHPDRDAIGVTVESPLVGEGRISVYLTCPGNNPLAFANYVGDWSNPVRPEVVGTPSANHVELRRTLDEHVSFISLAWDGAASIAALPATLPELRIIKAEYGADGQTVDLTSQLSTNVRDGRLVVRSGNHLGGDPAPQRPKTLRVRYRVGEFEREAIAAENDELILDAAPERGRVTLVPNAGRKQFSMVCEFSPAPIGAPVRSAEEIVRSAEVHWTDYWSRGGAIDLSGSTDPRWKELERRIVLSQYLMGVHEAGSFPPQESGLVNNGWYGRFHMEMVWWHGTHWALWNRWPELNRSIGIYERILDGAKKLAAAQGYAGARWPKCIGPDGREWPHEIHALLLWQQPHPIFFAELDYRANPTRETLERWAPIVEATADFMASYAHRNEATRRYDLGPPLHLVSENTRPLETRNPTFELGYWRFGLRVASQWRERLGLTPREEWTTVLRDLAPLPTEDGMYVLHEGVKDMWTQWNFEHPAITGVYGMLPGDGVDVPTMKKTLTKVSEVWQFNRIWGWDIPMLAMCAARVGEPEKAVDFLLHGAATFQFDEAGLATGGPYPYFPSNGGLLYTAAMMAAGWDGAPERPAPGFPADGTWKVRFEGLAKAP